MQIIDLQTVHKELNTSYISQYIVVANIEMLIYCFSKSLKIANTHYLRNKCALQAHHENNAYCVRIERVLSAVLNRCVLKRVQKKSNHKVSHKGSLRDPPSRQPSDRKRIAYLVNAAAELIGLEFFPQYLTPRCSRWMRCS